MVDNKFCFSRILNTYCNILFVLSSISNFAKIAVFFTFPDIILYKSTIGTVTNSFDIVLELSIIESI